MLLAIVKGNGNNANGYSISQHNMIRYSDLSPCTSTKLDKLVKLSNISFSMASDVSCTHGCCLKASQLLDEVWIVRYICKLERAHAH